MFSFIKCYIVFYNLSNLFLYVYFCCRKKSCRNAATVKRYGPGGKEPLKSRKIGQENDAKMLQPCCNRGEKLSMAEIDNADISASAIGSNS